MAGVGETYVFFFKKAISSLRYIMKPCNTKVYNKTLYMPNEKNLTRKKSILVLKNSLTIM